MALGTCCVNGLQRQSSLKSNSMHTVLLLGHYYLPLVGNRRYYPVNKPSCGLVRYRKSIIMYRQYQCRGDGSHHISARTAPPLRACARCAVPARGEMAVAHRTGPVQAHRCRRHRGVRFYPTFFVAQGPKAVILLGVKAVDRLRCG